MLGIRLSVETERRLTREARAIGQPKSALARTWIEERLDRESLDQRMREAATILAAHDRPEDYTESDIDE